MNEVVLFDKDSGEPVAMIQSSDPTFVMLNSNDDHYAVRSVSSMGDWKRLQLADDRIERKSDDAQSLAPGPKWLKVRHREISEV